MMLPFSGFSNLLTNLVVQFHTSRLIQTLKNAQVYEKILPQNITTND